MQVYLNGKSLCDLPGWDFDEDSLTPALEKLYPVFKDKKLICEYNADIDTVFYTKDAGDLS